MGNFEIQNSKSETNSKLERSKTGCWVFVLRPLSDQAVSNVPPARNLEIRETSECAQFDHSKASHALFSPHLPLFLLNPPLKKGETGGFASGRLGKIPPSPPFPPFPKGGLPLAEKLRKVDPVALVYLSQVSRSRFRYSGWWTTSGTTGTGTTADPPAGRSASAPWLAPPLRSMPAPEPNPEPVSLSFPISEEFVLCHFGGEVAGRPERVRDGPRGSRPKRRYSRPRAAFCMPSSNFFLSSGDNCGRSILTVSLLNLAVSGNGGR
jgi:hypothetical protein